MSTIIYDESKVRKVSQILLHRCVYIISQSPWRFQEGVVFLL